MAQREKTNAMIVISVIWRERPNAANFREVIKSLEGILSTKQVYHSIQRLKEKDILRVYMEEGIKYVKVKTFREPRTEEILIEAGLL